MTTPPGLVMSDVPDAIHDLQDDPGSTIVVRLVCWGLIGRQGLRLSRGDVLTRPMTRAPDDGCPIAGARKSGAGDDGRERSGSRIYLLGFSPPGPNLLSLTPLRSRYIRDPERLRAQDL